MKTLYVHIGTMKTGTTAVQGFLWDNRDVLEKYGFGYPDLHWLSQTVTRRRNGRFLVEPLENSQLEQEVFRKGMDYVEKLFETYENIVLSNEGIWGATYNRRASLWQELMQEGEKHGFQVKVIVYLRRQDEYLSSCWNQMIKMNTKEGVREWDEYLENIPKGRQLEYDKKLDSISEVIGKENVIVRRYEFKEFYQGSIYADFLQCMGLTMTDEYQVIQETRNGKLAGNMVEIKRIINTMPNIDENQNFYLRDVLLKISEDKRVEQHYSMLSKREAEEFLKKYEEGNSYVAREYLHEDAPLFDDTIKESIKWEKENENVTDDVIRYITGLGMQLKSENSQLKSENIQLQKRVDRIEQKLHDLRHPIQKIERKLSSNKENKK